MMKILYSNPSPYSAKVRMAAAYAGMDFESVPINTSEEPAELLDVNPLGRIPVLVPEDGGAIFDSRAITQWLNRQSRGALFPRNSDRRTQAERLEALADGICDSLLIHVTERRKRPEEKVHFPVLEGQWRKVQRALDMLEATLPAAVPKRIHAGHIALRALLGYLDLRFGGDWESDCPRLIRWAQRFDERFPELTGLLPQA